MTARDPTFSGQAMTNPLPALNERYQHTCFRLETLQDYAGVSAEERERVASWLRGRRRFRSVTDEDGYLRRVASHTLAGKRRSRVHVVTFPLSEYVRYELDAYRENVAVGERIGIADGRDVETALGPDFWLFDAGTDQAEAVIMRYDRRTAELIEFEHVTAADHPGVIAELERQTLVAQRAAAPLDEFVSALATQESGPPRAR